MKFRFALGLSALLLTMDLLFIPYAQGQGSAPEGSAVRGVALYDGLYGGVAQQWSLPEKQPFRFVPDLGDHLRSKVSSLEVGKDVGVILFGGKFFQNEDRECQPALGTKENPLLLWRGATSDLLPENQSNLSALKLEAPKDNFYQSMILFDRKMGPPPGALLTQRLHTYSTGCETQMERLNYRRIFLPPWGEDQGGTMQNGICHNLLGPVDYNGVRDVLRFNAAEQLILLNPADADPAYLSTSHRITVQLFDSVDCEGRSLELPFPGTFLTSFNLNDYGFGRTTRSLRVVYLEGLAISYANSMTPRRKPKDISITEVQPTFLEQEEQALGALHSAIEPESQRRTDATGQAVVIPQAVPKSARKSAEAPAIEIPIVQSPQHAVTIQPPSSSAFSRSDETMPQENSPTLALNNSKQQALQALFQAAGLSPAADQTMLPKLRSLEEEALQNQQTAQGKANNAASSNALELPASGQQSPRAQGGPVTLAPVTLNPVALNPAQTRVSSQESNAGGAVVLPSQAAVDSSASQSVARHPDRYENPVVGNYRLDYCKTEKVKECGKPVAQMWCEAKGYSRAVKWSLDRSIGALFPTTRIGDGSVCASYKCSGFKEIFCDG